MSVTLVPPAGSFSGENVLTREGIVTGFGLAQGSIQADGTFVLSTTPTPPYSPIYVLFGTFESDGSISNAIMLTGGQSLVLTGPRFSFDGTTLVIRWADDQGFVGPWFITLSSN